MIKIKNRIILVVLGVLVGLVTFGQNCNNFFESTCVMPSDWDYEINSQSINIPVFVGQTIKYSAVFYEGYAYSINFCAEEGLGNIQYRLLSTDVYIDKTFNAHNEDNMSYVEFENKNTRIILVEVKILRSLGTNIDPTDRKCLGIIIGQKKVENGFEF